MSTQIFADSVVVELQGNETLLHIDTFDKYCRYELIGFSQQKVEIEDYRPVANSALILFLEFNELNKFLEAFCSPAYLSISEDENGDFKLILSESDKLIPEFCLWMVSGIGRRIPLYQYQFIHSEAMDADHFSLLAVYHQTLNAQSSLLADPHPASIRYVHTQSA